LVVGLEDDSAALELCRQVRSQPGGDLKLVWIVTGRTHPEQFQALRAAGVDSCLLLPLESADVELRLTAARRRLENLDRLLRTEDALRKSIERFDLAASGAGEGLWVAQPIGQNWLSLETPVWYSPRFKSMLGYQDAEFPNVLESWRKQVHPEDWPRVHEALIDHVEHRAPYEVEYRMFTKPGETRWIAAKGQGDWNAEGALIRMAGSIRDITESRRVAEALQVSEEKWRSLVEHAPDAILVADPDGTVRFLNSPWHGHSIDEVVGRNFVACLPEVYQDVARRKMDEAVQLGQARFESSYVDAEGKIVWYNHRVGRIQRQNQLDSIILISTDISVRKRADQQRQEAFSLVENSDDFVGRLSSAGQVLYLNPAGCKLVGIPNGESAKAIAWPDYYLPPQHDIFRDKILPEVQAMGRWEGEVQLRHVRFGHGIDVHQKVFLVRDAQTGEPLCLGTITRDITERKRAETALRREQEFLRRLLDLQERDRQLVAYEIHDGLTQDMAAALMHFEAFQHRAATREDQADFERGLNLLRESVNEARRLISGLRPPVLDEMGIVASVEYLVNEARSEELEIQFVRRTSFARLSRPLESAIFRIVQEALTNVRKHSGARRARVELIEHGRRLRLVVRDWGRGFDPRQVSRERFGLQGIRQRARLLDTDVAIESAAGQGTAVVVDFPLLLDE
jgi:PAS domain S-box-containing protein